MLHKVLPEFPQYVLPLPSNVCISVTSLWLDQHITDTAVRQRRIRPHACVKAKGSHFDQRLI